MTDRYQWGDCLPDSNSASAQAVLRQFVEREVIHCVSTLCAEMIQRDAEDSTDLWDAPPDYEEAARAEGWIANNDATYSNPETGGTNDTADSWTELCDEECIDADDYRPEVFEHWIVSDWLADALEEQGELIARDFFGLTIWGRTTTGQAIMLDDVIRRAYNEKIARALND